MATDRAFSSVKDCFLRGKARETEPISGTRLLVTPIPSPNCRRTFSTHFTFVRTSHASHNHLKHSGGPVPSLLHGTLRFPDACAWDGALCWEGKTHNAQMRGATQSKPEFLREEAGDKLERRFISTENIGDKDSSSLDRKPQQQNVTSVRCFYIPTFHAKLPKPIVGDFIGFFPQILVNFQLRSIFWHVLSVSVSFNQLQSILISFNQFDSVKNAENLLTTGMKRCFRGLPSRGCKFKLEKAHFAARKKSPENRENEVRLRTPSVPPVKHSMMEGAENNA